MPFAIGTSSVIKREKWQEDMWEMFFVTKIKDKLNGSHFPHIIIIARTRGKIARKMAIQYYSDIAILMSMHKDNMAENSMTLEAIFQAETGSSKKYSY